MSNISRYALTLLTVDESDWFSITHKNKSVLSMYKEDRREINEKSERCTVLQWTRGEAGQRAGQSVWDVTLTPWSCAHPLSPDITGWCWLGQQGNTHAHSCFHKPCLAAKHYNSHVCLDMWKLREREQFGLLLFFSVLILNSLDIYCSSLNF